jgi:ribosome biogenesis SPOUT family RNA methylase Rps3
MTTDTAVRVTRLVIQDQMPLESISYVDSPDLKINKHETTQMPFRYVRDERGQPVMPEVSASNDEQHCAY